MLNARLVVAVAVAVVVVGGVAVAVLAIVGNGAEQTVETTKRAVSSDH